MELARLRESLETERVANATLRVSLEREKSDKDTALLRNAQVSQDFELAKQETSRQQTEVIEMQNRIESLEESLRSKSLEFERTTKNFADTQKRLEKLEEAERAWKTNEGTEATLRNNLGDLEEQLNDKTKVKSYLIFIIFI